jgi:hypothetical protein
MTRNDKIGFAFAAIASVGMTAVFLQDVRARGRAERAKIKADAIAEIDAISKAHETITKKIYNGDYRNIGLETILTDFKFYQIVSRND